ncbi:MAG TPA: YkgJ family cysteine cluster protein [Verrucomicrobiae bacterium]|nr:YkgJ family cysteine cluster protein [Verrucomicrobiae bacterium]
MKWSSIEIPAFQNWNCHGCSDCCRGALLIKITEEEKTRIEKQNWTTAAGVDPATAIVSERGYFRLGHQADGACVFLDAAGRCRIHAKFGEAAKPLACRLYPLAIHPLGDKLVVGLRFSCPSAASNRGNPLTAQRSEIQKLAAEVVPRDFEPGEPPAIAAAAGEDWPDFLRFVKWLDTSMTVLNVPVTLKFLRTLYWLNAVEKGHLDQITGAGADEILGVLNDSSREKVPALLADPPAPSRFGRVFFRSLVLEHARMVTVGDMKGASRYRLKMLKASGRFILGTGRTPALRPGLASVEFSAIENFPGKLSPSAEAMLSRFFRVKIQSLHFSGRAFHNAPLIEGFRNLALLCPIILWLARWQAVSAQRKNLTEDDIARAISMVDYHHGYTPYLRWRIRLLAQRDDITKLCAWYGR